MQIIRTIVGPVVVLATVIAGTGCKTVVRENIISSINTGIGISLSENPKTELYEAKLGYIRSQFYSVPTGKTVERDKNACCSSQQLSNEANKTPNVVSGIRFNSDLRHLMLGATISENFAVGDLAVNSPAAVAMYVAQAPDAARAAAAAKSATALEITPETVNLQKTLDDLVKRPLKSKMSVNGVEFQPDNTAGYARAVAESMFKPKTYKTVRREGGDNLEKLIEQLQKDVQ